MAYSYGGGICRTNAQNRIAFRKGRLGQSASKALVPLQTLYGPYCWEKLGGRRFRGVNLVPRPTDSGNGDTVPITPANFYDLFYDFGTNGATDPAWTHWLKPQIDAASSIGIDCVRIICQPTVRVGDATHHGNETFRGTITLAQLTNVYDTMITYLASKGMYFYPALMEAASVDVLTTAMILQFVDEATAIVSSTNYKNVIGIDISQEFDRSTWSLTPGNLPQAHNHARAALRQNIPFTSSIAFFSGLSTSLPLLLRAGANFIDLHTYVYTDSLLLTSISPNVWSLPIATGETGIAYNGFYFDHPGTPAQETVHPFSSELRARHYQDIVAGFGQRFDQQVTTVWGVTKEWPSDDLDLGLFSSAQDANFNFTTQRPEWVNPLSTVPKQPQSPTVTHTLDLTASNTTASNYPAGTTYALGWSQHDYSGTFNRSSNRVHRPNASLGLGVVDYWQVPGLDQTVSVDFDASQATPSGGQIIWSTSLRHSGDTVFNLAPTRFYFCVVNSQPLVPANDGQISIWKIDTAITALAATIPTGLNPFDLSHSYRMLFSATGTFPTTLSLTITDLTTSTTYPALTVTDSSARLQSAGSPGLPKFIGDVFYTNLQYTVKSDTGPYIAFPTITSVTTTSMALSWSATGGSSPYRYVVQYIALDSKGIPSGTDWTSMPVQTTTTATISGITPMSTNYAARVLVFDNSGQDRNW